MRLRLNALVAAAAALALSAAPALAQIQPSQSAGYPKPVYTAPAPNFAPAQATVTTSAAQLVAARSGRLSLTIVNNCTTPVELGSTSGVTTSNGLILPGVVGASITLTYSGAIYAVSTSSCAVSYYELY